MSRRGRRWFASAVGRCLWPTRRARWPSTAPARGAAVAFDVSHLGTVRLEGPEAREHLQRSFSNDLDKIHPGRAQYTNLLGEDGSVVDDIIVWWVDDERFDVMPNASNTAGVRAAVGGEDVTGQRAVVAVQGPEARERLSRAIRWPRIREPILPGAADTPTMPTLAGLYRKSSGPGPLIGSPTVARAFPRTPAPLPPGPRWRRGRAPSRAGAPWAAADPRCPARWPSSGAR